MASFSTSAFKICHPWYHYITSKYPVFPTSSAINSLTRLLTVKSATLTSVSFSSSHLVNSGQHQQSLRNVSEGKESFLHMNRLVHQRRLCHHHGHEVGSLSAGEACFESVEHLATEVLKASRETDVMSDALSKEAVKILVGSLRGQGFDDNRIQKLLSRRLWLLKEPNQTVGITECLLQHSFPHPLICQLIGVIPYNLHGSLDQIPGIINEVMFIFGSQGMSVKDVFSILRRSPHVLYTDLLTIQKSVTRLKSVFSARDIKKLLRKSPGILADSWSDIYQKYEYAIYSMVYTNDDIVNSSFLSHSFDHIRNRHLFLVRSGLFVTVSHKLESALNPNPTLSDIVDTSDSTFLHLFPVTDLEGFLHFSEMRAMEVEMEDEDVDELTDEDVNDDIDVSDHESEKLLSSSKIYSKVKQKNRSPSN